VFEVDAGDGALDALGVFAWEVADVSDGGDDEVVRAEILIDGLGFAGRLDDDEVAAGGIAGLEAEASGGTEPPPTTTTTTTPPSSPPSSPTGLSPAAGFGTRSGDGFG
jgi:hypothetical protein